MSHRRGQPQHRSPASSVARVEPFDISALLPPSDDIIADRRRPVPLINLATTSSAESRSTRVASRSGSSARTRAASPGNRQVRMRPLRAPIAGSPGSSPATARPLRVTNHSRGDFPFQPSTVARAATEIDQINSRARRSAPSASVPSNERFPTNTMMPTGGSSESAVAFANASRTADSSDNSALITRRVGELNRVANSAASAVVSPSVPLSVSANSSQLPAGAADAPRPGSAVELSTHSVSKIFCASGSAPCRHPSDAGRRR